MTGILYTIIITASTSNLPNSLHDHFSEELGEKGGGEDDDAVVGNCCRKVCNAICVYFEYLIRLSDMKGKGMGGGDGVVHSVKGHGKQYFSMRVLYDAKIIHQLYVVFI